MAELRGAGGIQVGMGAEQRKKEKGKQKETEVNHVL